MIERLLGDLPFDAFLDRHYARLPHSRPGGAAGFTSFPGRPAAEAILRSAGEVDAFCAREGRMWEGGKRPTVEEARTLGAEGYTLVVRSAERHDPELERLAEGFRADFKAPVNVHVYCTPAGATGFGWHYDAEDVFILQTHGAKEYRLRKNTVNPWPVLEGMGRDLRFEREGTPVLSCLLQAGDWLYIPTGWWHEARGGGGEGATLAIGLMTPTGLDLLDRLRREFARDILWRQRLPVAGDRAEAMKVLREELARDLQRRFSELGPD